jgi:hypothetical protein
LIHFWVLEAASVMLRPDKGGKMIHSQQGMQIKNNPNNMSLNDN